MPDDDKPPVMPGSAARAGSKPEDGAPEPIFKTQEHIQDEAKGDAEKAQAMPTPGLSYSPGLVEVPNSRVPGLGNGGMISHVMGPGQAPVDPIAAGLDTNYNPVSRNEDRTVTHTGVLGAGPRPSTYAEKPDGQMVQQSTDGSMEEHPAPKDTDVGMAPIIKAQGEQGDAPRDVANPEGKPAEAKPAV